MQTFMANDGLQPDGLQPDGLQPDDWILVGNLQPDDLQLAARRLATRTTLVAFSDGSTAAMGAASFLKSSSTNEWLWGTMAAHASTWLPMPSHYSQRLELERLATAGTWEVLGILLSLQLVEGYIRAMEGQCVEAKVYGDNNSVLEFCVHGSDLCYQKGAGHLAPMVDLVRARIERLKETNNVVTFPMPAEGRNSFGIRRCHARLKLVRPLTRKPYPDDLVSVALEDRMALEETFSLLHRAKQEEASEVFEIMRYY